MIEAIAKVITDTVRSILFMLDQVVYGFIPTLYKLIISLANVDLYTGNAAVMSLLNRIYILVGIFMLFKLAFSILRYVVDPNSFSDQSKGFTSLVKRVLIAMVLLVTIPWLFGEIYNIQAEILKSNIIPNLILGTKGSGSDQIEESAKDLQFMMFGPFFSLNTETSALKACEPDDNRPLSNIIGTTDMAMKNGCLEAFGKAIDEDTVVQASGTRLEKLFKTDTDANRDFKALGGLLTMAVDDGVYAINYTPIVSTLCGGYLAFLLLSFCIDVASRTIKLLFLQILSPVAIITSVDPASSSQSDKLKDWGMECLRTFLSLFLRLVVIYTVIQMVKIITSALFVDPRNIYNEAFRGQAQPSLNIFVYIFLILGAFSVAKKIPELLEKAFGIKMSGELSMNPFKNFKENVGFQKMGALGAGLGVGIAGAATGAGAGRVLSGLYNGIKGKNFSEVQKGMVEGNRKMRNAISDGSTFGGRMRSRITNFTGIQGALGKIEDEKVREENYIHEQENDKIRREDNIRGVREEISQKQAVSSAIDKMKNRAYQKVTEGKRYRNAMAQVDALKAQAEQTKDESERLRLMQEARRIQGETERDAHNVWAQEWMNGDGRNDAAIFAAMEEYKTAAGQAGLVDFDYGEAAEMWNQNEDITRGVARATSLISGEEQAIKEIDQNIKDAQNRIREIDERHKREQSNYDATGGQSGGTRERNLTDRPDAGQHPGPGGYGPGGFGPGGPGRGPGGPGRP